VSTCCQGGDLDDGEPSGGGRQSTTSLDVVTAPLVIAAAALTPAYQFTVPASTLARDGDSLEVEIWGNVLQNNAAAQTWFVGVSLGGVVLWGAVSVAHALDVDRKPHHHKWRIARLSNTTLQMGGTSLWNNQAALPVVGIGNPSLAPQAAPVATVNVDPIVAGFNTALALEVAVQPSVAGMEWVRKYASTTLHRAP
jgi:hypothetical protein